MASVGLALLLGCVVTLTIWSAHQDREVRRSLEQRSAVSDALNDARAQNYLGAAAMATVSLAGDTASSMDLFIHVKTQADADLSVAKTNLTALGESDSLARIRTFEEHGDGMEADAAGYLGLVQAGDTASLAEAAVYYQQRLWPAAQSLLAELEQLASEQQAKLVAERAAADADAQRNLAVLIALSAFTLVAGITSLMMLSLSVVRPLASLQTRVRQIACGDTRATATVAGPQEVASLARDFNTMISARRRAEDALVKARDELELRVQERTAALQAASEESQRLARTDALTQLANHRSLLDSLSREVEASVKSGCPLSVLMMDIDGFKLFNDTYGHAVGDEALKLVAGVLRDVSGEVALAGRYGGDEFLVVLPDTDKVAAKALGERVMAAVGKIEFKTGDGIPVPISLSLGLASFPEDAESKDRLLAVADGAMYEAKRLGSVDRRAPRMVAMDGEQFHTVFGALDSLVQAIQYRDRYTKTHSDMVAEYAAKLALQAGLSDEGVRALRIAGVLHDIGKLVIPDEILKKPGPLTEAEYEVIKRHPMVGEMLIRESPFLEDVMQAVGCHHENYDGSGYPRGLRGEEIPLPGRVMTIVDAYSAMRLDRPYRKALPERRSSPSCGRVLERSSTPTSLMSSSKCCWRKSRRRPPDGAVSDLPTPFFR